MESLCAYRHVSNIDPRRGKAQELESPGALRSLKFLHGTCRVTAPSGFHDTPLPGRNVLTTAASADSHGGKTTQAQEQAGEGH